MKCLAIGGEPATGKTTLMKSIIKNMDGAKTFKYGLLAGMFNEKTSIAVMGIYDGQGTFEGTDRLSMAVNKDFLSYLEAKCKGANPRHIVFEGDRLFSATNLRYILDKYQTRICILKQSEQALHKRHMARGDTQSEKFLKGRKTKIDNIQKEFSGNSEIFWLNEISDTKSLSSKLWRWLSEDTL